MAESSSGRIRVLRVIARLNVGGPALHVTYLTAGLTERGYDTTLVAGSIARGEESMAYVAEAAGAQVITLPGLSREISPLRDSVAIVRLALLIRRVRPKILHTHTAKAGTVGRIAALLAGDARPPIVVHTFHGHVLRGYFSPAKTRFFRVLERLLAKVTTVLIAVSPEVRDDLVALGVAPREKFAVVRLGIELEERVRCDESSEEVRRRLGIPPEHFVVGWLGRMTGVKQTSDLLTVLAALRERGVDAGLLVVGDGPDRDAFEQQAQSLGLMRHCLFLGYQEEVAPWYAAMDAVALPSGNEGTPVTVIEALAAGRPVAAYNVGGVPDVVRDGVDGFVVEPGDTAALTARLAELAADPELRERMGAAGRDRVLERYSVGRLLDDVDRLYRDTIEVTREGLAMGYSFGSIDELGEGYGFRKVRSPLGITAFGANAIVMPPHFDGFLHYHERQDELYFVHSGSARVEVEGEDRVLGPGGLFHCESTTPRKVSNAGDDDLVLLVVGGKDGYVERDGQLVDPEKDLARRQSFG